MSFDSHEKDLIKAFNWPKFPKSYGDVEGSDSPLVLRDLRGCHMMQKFVDFITHTKWTHKNKKVKKTL